MFLVTQYSIYTRYFEISLKDFINTRTVQQNQISQFLDQIPQSHDCNNCVGTTIGLFYNILTNLEFDKKQLLSNLQEKG